MIEITYYVAFLAGLISFLSPCILPLVPGLLVYLAGSTIGKQGPTKQQVLLSAVFFVLGFSVVFSLLGALLNSVLSRLGLAYDTLIWMSRVGGAIIIFFGLYLMGIVRISYLEREHKWNFARKFNSKLLTSFIFGAAFATGWTPCVGAALGGILTLAATQPGSAFGLLFTYSLGLGVPFLMVGLFVSQATVFINRYQNSLIILNTIFGVILVILGGLIFTQNLNRIANFEFLIKLLDK
mgnify:FL=1